MAALRIQRGAEGGLGVGGQPHKPVALDGLVVEGHRQSLGGGGQVQNQGQIFEAHAGADAGRGHATGSAGQSGWQHGSADGECGQAQEVAAGQGGRG